MEQHVIQQQITARQRIIDCYNIPTVPVVQQPVDLNKSLSDELVKASIDDMIEKGEISDTIGRGYGAGAEAIKFSKTGKEIKDKIPSVLDILTSEKNKLEVQAEVLRTEIGIEPTDACYAKLGCPSLYEYSQTSPQYDEALKAWPEPSDTHKLCQKYNSICYMLRNLLEDIQVLNVLLFNLSDTKSYQLGVSQLIALHFG